MCAAVALAAFALHAETIGNVTFTPTHVWTGAAGTTAFANAGNWKDANGAAAADAPGAGSVVYIPAPASGDRTVVVSSAFSIGALYIGRDGTAVGTVTLRFDHCKNNSVAGDVHLFAGATLTAKEAPDNTITTFAQEASSSYKVNIVAGGSFTIDSGASVDVTGKGFSKGKPSGYCGGDRNGGPGAFAGITLAERAKVNTWTAYGSTPYGSVYFPTNLAPTTTLKLFGGGATYLHADGNFVLNGSVLSNPYHGGTYAAESCASGGSILIECATLSGDGTISAAPQRSVSLHSAGGGRIAVHHSVASDMSAFTGSIQAQSVSAGDRHCGAGTIYLRFAGQSLGDGELIVDNNSVNCNFWQVTELTEDNIEFGKVTVRNGGRLHLREGQTLRVRRSIDATGGSITNDATAVVDCSYPNEIHFAGKTAFSNFVCTNDQATLRFAVGSGNLFTMNNGGMFQIVGSAQRSIPLLPEDLGETWYAALAQNAAADISHVAVSNSNASAGAGGNFLAIDSQDLGGNSGWTFSAPILPGDPITWTGVGGDSWVDANNWLDKNSVRRIPVSTDSVAIPAGCQNYPSIAASASIEVGSLSIASGASLSVGANATLSVSGATTVSGSLSLGRRTSLVCEGDLVLADGSTYSGANANIELSGGSAQSVDLDGRNLNIVLVRKSGGSVAFVDAFSCKILDMRATAAATVTFPAAKTVSANVFLAAGYVSGAAVLELGPADGSGTWGLNVGEKGLVTSAVVAGCDAGGGTAVIADTRSTLSGCSNWSQPGRVHIWNGAATGGDYGAIANWTPNDGQIAGSRLAAVAYEAMTISQTAAASPESLDLFAGEYSVAFNSTATLSVSEGLEARTNVTMSLSKPVTVGGDVIFRRGSSLTHAGHSTSDSTQKYAVNITSGGKVTIEPQVSVNVVSKGFNGTNKGPGGGSGTNGPVATHGGRLSGWGSPKNCYGSILLPNTVGSSGYNSLGGGSIKIVATGEISLGSDINASGAVKQYAGSAGSVCLVCSRLSGTGSLYAYAGNYYANHAGSGGRVAVVQTTATDFSAWSGVADAHGAYYANFGSNSRIGGAGTVYMKSAGSNGQVIIENKLFLSAQETQIPMADDGNAATAYADIDFLVPSNMTISLIGNTTIHDLDLQATTSRLKLNGYTLTIKSGRHRDGKRWGAPYSNLVTEGGGTVVWIGKPGFSLSVR